MLDILEKSIVYLCNQVDNPDARLKQKKLVTPISVFLKHVKVNENLQEYYDLLFELVNLHEKHKSLSGSIIVREINLDKYPQLRNLVLKAINEELPYEEVDDFIDLILVKANSISIKNKSSHIIEKLVSLENKSDHEVVDEYKQLIISEYLKLLEYEDISDTLEFDPDDLDKLFETIKRLNYQAKTKLKVPSGFEPLDNYFLSGGFEAGRIYLFGSPPGMGKSTLMLNFVKNMIQMTYDKKMLQSDKPPAILYITLENEPLETYERLTRMLTQKPIRLRDLSDEELLDIEDVYRQQLRTKLLVHYSKPGTNISQIILDIATYSETHRLVAIFIDYLDLLHYDLLNIKEKRHELGAITFTLKLIGKTYKCPVISPTQLNTSAYPDSTGKKIVIPSMKHLDESRQKAQNADFVGLMFPIHKDYLPPKLQYEFGSDEYRILGINIDKNRDDPKGMVFAIANFNIYTIKMLDIQSSYIISNSILSGTSNSNNN